MEVLNIKIVESKKDLSDLYVLENLADQCHIRHKKYFGIARLNNLPVGYWNGVSFRKLFNSSYIFVVCDYRKRGFGYKLKKHQLQFAKSLGCSFVTSTVENSNLRSLAIQEKSSLIQIKVMS